MYRYTPGITPGANYGKPGHIHGVDLAARRAIELRDPMVSGNTTNGQVGALGWTRTDGAGTGSTSFNTGTLLGSNYEISTGATADNRSCLTLGAGEAIGVCQLSELVMAQFVVSASWSNTNCARWVGFASDFNLDAASNVLLVGLDTSVSATNLATWVRAGGVGSPADSGVARPTNSAATAFTFARDDSGTIRIVMGDSTQLGSFASGALPVAVLGAGAAVRARGAASRSIAVHYFFGAFNPNAVADVTLIQS
jgi:hypothetical protein